MKPNAIEPNAVENLMLDVLLFSFVLQWDFLCSLSAAKLMTYHIIRKTTVFIFKSNYTIFIGFVVVIFAKHIVQVLLLVVLLLGGWFVKLWRHIHKESSGVCLFVDAIVDDVFIVWNVIRFNVIVVVSRTRWWWWHISTLQKKKNRIQNDSFDERTEASEKNVGIVLESEWNLSTCCGAFVVCVCFCWCKNDHDYSRLLYK